MTKNIYLFLFIFIWVTSYTQDIPFKIQKSDIFKDEYRESQIVLSEEDGNGGFLLVRSYNGNKSSTNTGYYFEHYDTDLKLISEFDFQIEHPIFQKNAIVFGVFRIENKIRIIEMYYDIKEKSYFCIANSISTDDYKVEKKVLFQLSRDEVKENGGLSLMETYYNKANKKSVINDSFGTESEEPIFSFDFSFSGKSEKKSASEGNTKMALVSNREKNFFSIVINFNQKEVSKKLKIYVFDNNLNTTIEHDYTMDPKDKKYFLQNIELSKDGKSIYLLNKNYSTDLKEKGVKYQFEIIKFSKGKVESQTFDTQDHFIGSLKIISINDKLICIGFYSDIYDKAYKGIGYYEFAPSSLTLKKSKFSTFNEQFILEKYGKLKDQELKFLTYKNILITDKNELIFNAEESYAVTSPGSYTPYGSSGGHTSYNYDDIVSVKIDREGNLIWCKNINKRQSGDETDFFVSYSSILVNDNACFFINASDKIKNLDDNRIEFRDTRKNKFNQYLIQINQNGDFNYQKILDDEENEVPFMVSNSIKSVNSIFFLGRKGAKKQLLKVKL